MAKLPFHETLPTSPTIPPISDDIPLVEGDIHERYGLLLLSYNTLHLDLLDASGPSTIRPTGETDIYEITINCDMSISTLTAAIIYEGSEVRLSPIDFTAKLRLSCFPAFSYDDDCVNASLIRLMTAWLEKIFLVHEQAIIEEICKKSGTGERSDTRQETTTACTAHLRSIAPSSTSAEELAPPVCPILPVNELHGRSVKQHLETVVSTPEAAQAGDIVAVLSRGAVFDRSWTTMGRTFLIKTDAGLVERRLHELKSCQVENAAGLLGRLDDDWENVQDFPEACQHPEEDSPRRYEIIHCRDALLLLWLDRHRSCDMPPALSSEVEVPAALLIATTGPTALPVHRLEATKMLAEEIGFVQFADPISER